MARELLDKKDRLRRLVKKRKFEAVKHECEPYLKAHARSRQDGLYSTQSKYHILSLHLFEADNVCLTRELHAHRVG